MCVWGREGEGECIYAQRDRADRRGVWEPGVAPIDYLIAANSALL